MTTQKIAHIDIPDLLESSEIAEGEPPVAARRVEKSPTAFRTISEVADELRIPQHVLRFWETKFPQIRPMKRGGGRRYYRPEDMVLLRQISQLLYEQGFTIRGVQKLMRERGLKKAGDNWLDGFDAADAAPDLQPSLIEDATYIEGQDDHLAMDSSNLSSHLDRRETPPVRSDLKPELNRQGLKQILGELVILRDRLRAISR